MKCSCGSKGFTLVEVSIVLIIVGILSVALIRAYSLYYSQYRLARTTERISQIEDALENFLLVKGRLPCAAPRNVLRTDSAYGREEDCTTVSPSTVRASGIKGGNIRIGLVPTRTLGIADAYSVDGWGRLLTYAVSENQSSVATFTNDGGEIDVLDESGTSRLIGLGNFAHYVVVSSGRSGRGGYNESGTPYLPCDTSSSEGENCDDDGVFLESVLNEAGNGEYFDDKISYSSVMAQLPNQEPEKCLNRDDVTGLYDSNITRFTSWIDPETYPIDGSFSDVFSSLRSFGDVQEFYGRNCPSGWEVADSSTIPGFRPIRRYSDVNTMRRVVDTGRRRVPQFINKIVGKDKFFVSLQRLPTTLNGDDLNNSVLCSKQKESSQKRVCFESSMTIVNAGSSSGITRAGRPRNANNGYQIDHENAYSGTPKCPDGWTVTAINIVDGMPLGSRINRQEVERNSGSKFSGSNKQIDIRCAR